MGIDIAHLRSWIGREQQAFDMLTLFPCSALAATLDRDDPPPAPGDALPLLWHWLYFLPTAPQATLGPDGHPPRGDFLPPVALPRRMWAGGRLAFHAPLTLGTPVTRRSTVADVTLKEGKAGPLIFVLVRHEISTPAGLALSEEHDIVYRDAPNPGETPPPRPAATDEAWRRDITPDPALLFRYSALTFNGHRIHYDHPYATGVEGYPGLVVHGPLLATLLAELARRHDHRRMTRFEFRAISPVYDIAPFTVCGRPEQDGARLWIRRQDGALAMQAEASFAPDSSVGG